ncbi:lysostaphin resistance A-like protein [Carboxylicivirga taeanensis]|uniref:CPBP family intramembrane glutamic endopeptidase n=1 Tax=Carboxylicivirga taeanensis TaxID=1416875 RepID=UPI003F6DBEEE
MQGYLAQLPPLVKLIMLFTVVLFFGSLSTLLMGLMAAPVFGVDMSSKDSILANVGFLQAYQTIQSISLFIIPSLLCFFACFKSFSQGINGEKQLNIKAVALTIVLIVVAQAFIAYSAWFNHQLELPESLSHVFNWMAEKEQEAVELTQLMIQKDNWEQLFFTVLMMSVLPAMGEEWLFRGILQRQLALLTKNKHIAIVLTAILFSAIHMQFLTFLPRFFLGIVLGYLFVLSGNLWLAVIAHFTNNLMAIMAFQVPLDKTSEAPLTDFEGSQSAIAIISSALAIVLILYLIKKICDRSSKPAKP